MSSLNFDEHIAGLDKEVQQVLALDEVPEGAKALMTRNLDLISRTNALAKAVTAEGVNEEDPSVQASLSAIYVIGAFGSSGQLDMAELLLALEEQRWGLLG